MKSNFGSLFGTNRVSSSTVRHARRTKRRTSVETLESRVLLAADSVVGGFTANPESGLGEIGKELQQFVRQDPTFDRLVPGVLERQGVGADAVDGS